MHYPARFQAAQEGGFTVTFRDIPEAITQHVGPSELARRLGTSPQSVNRLVNLAHTTKIDELARALGALDRRLAVSLARA